MARLSDTDIECALVWKLARFHGWSRYISEDTLVNDAPLPSSEVGRAREICRTLRTKPYIRYQRGRGVGFVGNTEDQIATFLRDTCDYSEFRIESTLSHFEGFAALDSDDNREDEDTA
jgi:hypothetical protein